MEKVLTLLPPEDREEFSEFFKTDSMPGFDQKIIDGYRLYPGFGADREVEYAYSEWDNIRSTDVFIVSFPKTGTNWVAEIVRHIMFQEEELEDITQHLPFQFFLLEVGTRKKFDYMDKLKLGRRYISTHLPAQLLNMEKIKKAKAKVIYVLRNPKDQIVSWQNFAGKLPHGQREPWKSWLFSGWDYYFEQVIAGMDKSMLSKSHYTTATLINVILFTYFKWLSRRFLTP